MTAPASAAGPVVYRITNRVNGRFYVGSTVSLARRWQDHRASIEGGGMTLALRRDIERHGFGLADFEFRVLRRFSHAQSMRQFEQALLRLHWGTFSNYNAAAEVWPGAVRTLFVAWNPGELEQRVYLSLQALARDLTLARLDVVALLEQPARSADGWHAVRLHDGQASASALESAVRAGLDLPVGWLDAGGNFLRRLPPWGEELGALVLPENEHQWGSPRFQCNK